MIKRFYILLLAIVASVGMSFAQASIVSSGTKGGMSYTFYDNGLLEISGSGALPGRAFTNWDGGFGTSVKNIRFAEDCEVYGLNDMWFGCYTETSQLETIEINSVVPIMFSGASGEGIFYQQDGAVTLTITAPGIVDVEGEIIGNYGSPVNMIFNLPATTVFEKKWFSGLRNNFAVTIPTGAKGHIPAGYVFTDSYNQDEYDHLVADGHEDLFWRIHSDLVEGVDYTFGVESTFEITAENASQIFGQATVSFQAPTEASNSEWVLWRKSDLKTFSDMSSGEQKVYKDVTVKVNNGVYNTDAGWGIHFESLGEDGVQFVAPEGKVFKRIVILNEYGTFSDPNWSYDGNYKKWSGSADTVGFVGNICGISLIEFELEASAPAAPANSCGDGLIWELNGGALTISYTGTGTGVMDNYASMSDAPWYSHKDDITSVTITDGVKSVGSYSFGYYGNLVTVTIGNDVETIGYYAFGDCYKFTTLNLGNSVKHIGDRAFMWAKVLTGFTLPSTLETIGERAFLQNKLITSLTIPSNVTSIGPSAFMYCAALTSVTVEATTPPTLGATVFDGVPTSSIPLHVPSGSVAAYTAADQWKDFDIQDPTPAYEKVMNLINEIPDPVVLTAECKVKIDAARAAYDALSDGDKDLVTNSATLTIAEEAFENVMNIWLSGDCDAILWKDTILTIRKHAGEGNGAMADYTDYYGDNTAPWFNSHWYNPQPGDIVIKSVTIEEGVTHIGDCAFGWMSELKTITIPSSVTSIGEDAFYWSKAVDDIYLTADPSNLTWVLPYSADNQFKPEKATRCHVPADLLTAYQEKFGTLNMTFVGDLNPITPLTPEQQQALDAAKDKIAAIPSPVVYTPACKDAIDAARAAYDALTPDMLKQLVSNYATLTAAEATYANLKDVVEVEAQIAAIPQPVTLKLATRDSINNARAAYDALTADQQALVSNYQTLLDAEATMATLNPGGGMPADALNGKFTINAGGDQIAFAKGNLQATTEDLGEHWTWSFAANQWNYLGIVVANSKINGNGTVSENGTVDLFGWSTAATYYGINNSSWPVDYIGDFVDWGPNMGAGWRTLTKDEWNYLLQHSSNGRATVNDKKGHIFLPDDWSGPAFTANPDNFTTNVYSGDDWTAMENAGAVFLPSGPARNGIYALIANDAKYCSSTSLNNDTSYVFTIYYNQSQSACTGTNRAYGCMVRLVSEGGGATPLDSAQVAKDLIEAIPAEITLDAACVNAVQAARDAYNALTEATKGALDPAIVNKLTDAEAALTALNQAVADEVIAKINAIPTPVELKLATRDSIESARAAYDALTTAQQDLVTNYQKLLDAEAALAALVPTPTPVPGTPTVWDMNELKVGDIIYEGDQLTIMSSPRYFNDETIREDKCPYTLMKSAGETSYVLKDKDGSYLLTDGSLAITPTSVGLLVTSVKSGDINVVVYSLANVLDSAQAVKDLIDAIPTPVEYPTSGPAIAAALVAYQQLSDAAKGALDDADVQKMTDAATQYAALDAIAAIEAIPAEIVYDPAVKAAIETAREKYDALIDASKALVDDEVVAKLTNAEQAWADLVALIEHTVSYIGKDGELKNEKVALLHIPNPAPDFNGHEFVRWDVKAGDFLEEGLRIKAVYTPIITTNPAAYDSLMYNGTAQTLITAGVAKEGHIEYSLYPEEPESWSANLPTATNAGVYAVSYKLVREGHEDYMAGSVTAVIAKAPVTYVVPQAYDTLAYNYNTQVLVTAGQTNDGTFEYGFDPTLPDSWSADLPQAMNAGTYNVYFRVNGDMNHLDSTAVDPIAVTIAKAELTATADDKNVIYGDAVPEYSVTYAGWQGDDDAAVLTGDIAFACDYNDTTSVGTYPIVPSGVDAANYTITFVNGKVTVAKAESGCIAPLVYDTLVYNGANQTLIIAGQPMGGEMQYSLDTTVLDCWSTSLPQAKDAGTYNVYYRVKGDMNHNDHYYDLITVSIAKAALTATAEDKTVTYGDQAPEYTVVYAGWHGTDDASVLTGAIAYACDYLPTSNVDEYTITPSGVDAANYIITFVNGKVTVGKAALMITAEDKNVIYGDAVPTYTATYSGWKNSDDASVVSNLAYTCEYAPTSNVGEYAIVPSGAEAMNYAISYTNGKVTVSKAVLTITANDTVMIYGDEAPAFTASYSGWLNGDDESLVSGLAFTTPYQPGSPVGTYAIHPVDATALNYQIAFADGALVVNKTVVSVSGAEAHTAKFADGHANAEVTNQGVLNGVKLNDPLTHVTTAVFSSAEVSEHLTITLFYELTGDAALLANYDLQPTSEVFTTEGVIIEPFLPNNTDDPEDKESKVQEGIEVYAYGYCEGDNVGLKYHLNSGNPDQYMIEFEDSRFADVDWTPLDEKSPEGVIYITVPVDVPTGDYKMTVTFRDSRFAWLESQPLSVTFHVNLPETYVRPLFDNTIVLVDTCECFTDIQWYHRADASEQWQPISGANGHYLHVEGKLTGEYFVKAKMNGVETYTCEQTDMQTLYGAETNKQAKVKAYPNPVVDNTNVTIENSEAWEHNLRIVNLMGVELENTTFEGNHTVVEMSGYPQGNYMISVDGIMVKVLKQ